MGCGGSSVSGVSPTRRKVRPSPIISTELSESYESSDEKEEFDELNSVVCSILTGITSFPFLEGIHPVLPLSCDSFPMFLQDFNLNLPKTVTVTLPSAALATYCDGRLVVIGSISMVYHANIIRTEVSLFIENCISWAANRRDRMIHILLLGMQHPIATILSKDLSSFGYNVDISDDIPGVYYNLIFIESSISNLEVINFLDQYLESGGSIFVFFSKEVNIKLNEFLSKWGCAFSRFPLVARHDPISVQKSKKLCNLKFPKIVKLLRSSLESENLDIEYVDEIYSVASFYLKELNDQQESLLLYNLLNNRKKSGNIKDSIYESAIIYLIDKLPPEHVPLYNFSKDFPLEYNTPVLINRNIQLILRKKCIISSGMYLPPCICGKIITSTPLWIIVGSHRLNLIKNLGPFKRPPNVILLKYIVDQEDVSSPFGGIIYLYSENSTNATIKFENMSRYPLFSVERPNNWKNTFNFEAPWSEIEMKSLVITLPTRSIKKIPDLDRFCNLVESLINYGTNLLNCRIIKCKRIIYDIELPNGYKPYGDTVYILMSSLDDFLLMNGPTKGLLVLLSAIFLTALPENHFDSIAEFTISLITGCYSMIKLWDDVNISSIIPQSTPTLFYDLWSAIYPDSFEKLSNSLRDYFSKQLYMEEINIIRRWKNFIIELSKYISINSEKLMSRFFGVELIDKLPPERLSKYIIDAKTSQILDDVDNDIVYKDKEEIR